MDRYGKELLRQKISVRVPSETTTTDASTGILAYAGGRHSVGRLRVETRESKVVVYQSRSSQWWAATATATKDTRC